MTCYFLLNFVHRGEGLMLTIPLTIACYFLLNFVEYDPVPEIASLVSEILLFSFELCLASSSSCTSLYTWRACYFLLNYAHHSKRSSNMAEEYMTCYFLLNYAADFVVRNADVLESLLFSFELCDLTRCRYNRCEIPPKLAIFF